MAVKKATFSPRLVPTNLETRYITMVETSKPIKNTRMEEVEYNVDMEFAYT